MNLDDLVYVLSLFMYLNKNFSVLLGTKTTYNGGCSILESDGFKGDGRVWKWFGGEHGAKIIMESNTYEMN